MAQPLSADDVADRLAGAQTYASTVVVTAVRVTEDAQWTTARGDRLVAHAGDWWVSDGDDTWSVLDEVFAATYEPVDGEHFRKTATISAVRVDHPFAVRTLEGIATGESGDWLARNPSGECWPISADVFQKRYRPAAAG